MENYRFRRKISAAVLAGLGFVAGCGQAGEYVEEKNCGIVDDRLATTGSKIDGVRFVFGDGNLTQVPDDKYLIHTTEFGTVEVEAEEYMDYQIGSEYCETSRVFVPTAEE